ncbi:MAG: carboxypeptidase-like regulatory domain-containing protein, partial [Terriglobia bacterium]
MMHKSAILCCAMMWTTVLLHGQSGGITGLVTDPSGAVVAAASVTATNEATGLERAVSTSGQGYYSVPLLPAGTYRVAIEAQGFRRAVRSGITLAVAQTARLDFAMEIGELSQEMNVAATAPLLETENASLGSLVDV